ncbi:TIGR04255 family protein [Flavobacterium sp. N2820]|uniref:TIGR04255 family protein n=1 Tax=Flavobacterium sp. N2820 TaxID=2986834 RepID=UPI002223F740|nr:TIGR04255 family protein [Flavobacterium sp. N2820]
MDIPSSINPNRLKNSIIEVFIDYNEPFEILFGDFYNNVLKNGQYKNIEISSENSSTEDLTTKKILFYNENIKFVFSENKLVINCNEKYESWSIFFPEIKNVFSFLNLNSNIIITKIGLRYISEYPGIDLKENMKFEFKFGFPEIISNSYSFNTEFNYKDSLAILTIRNQIPFNNKSNKNEVIKVSLIDIDIVKDNLNLKIEEIDNIFDSISKSHTYEKEIFFNILREDFIKLLNPQY